MTDNASILYTYLLACLRTVDPRLAAAKKFAWRVPIPIQIYTCTIYMYSNPTNDSGQFLLWTRI